DGRPTKLDGNPLHPPSGGATDTFAQASILDLYDPARSQRFVQRGKKSDRAAFESHITQLRKTLLVQQGDSLAFLVEETHSPTRERLRAELEKIFPHLRWIVYEPLLSEAQSFATELSFGGNLRVVPKLDRADVILALDSDFLDCGQGDLASVRAFSSRRRVSAAQDTMNRLYVVENHFTLTGALADHRLRCPASQIATFAYALAGKILATTKDANLGSVIGTLKVPVGSATFDEQWLSEAANDLVAKPGASLVLAGPNQPVVVQLIVYAINSALKNLGQTLVLREFPHHPNRHSILSLAGDIHDGRIEQLFIFGGDPVYNAPRVLAGDRRRELPLDWADLQKKVPEIVRLGYYEDATSALSHWHVPAAHYLESWGDALTADGAYLSIQPMILPLFGGLSETELMKMLHGAPKVEGPELVQETFRATAPPGDFQTAWSRFLRDGFAAHVLLRDRTAGFNATAAAALAQTPELWALRPAPAADSPEIVLVGSYAMDDGRYINNGWLQELPDPITKLTWDNAALMSPSFAKRLEVETGDLVQITITEALRDANSQPVKRELAIAAVVSPGHAENSMTIPLGYGRKKTGPIGEEAGFNAYLLRTASDPHFIVADGRVIESVKVTKVGKKYPLSI